MRRLNSSVRCRLPSNYIFLIEGFGENKMSQNISNNHSSDYSTARSISIIISFIGWIAVIAGVIIVLVGLNQGVKYGSGMGVFIVVLPGLGASISGLFLVVAGQITRATVDNASHTKEILKIMKERI